jgi:sugar phosphate isomerase/epimerase
MTNRRQFLQRCAASAAGLWINPVLTNVGTDPSRSFPTQPHDRIAVSSYPFRDFITGSDKKSSQPKVELKDFAAHVIEKFHVNKIEPWTGHFPSTDHKYLEQYRTALEASHAQVVNMAVDGERSPYAADRDEREQAIAFSKRWIDVAAAIGSPSIRANIPEAHDSKPDLERAVGSLSQVVEYAQSRDVVVHLENDNPISEDPSFLVALIAKVNSPWLRALPDFANTLARGDQEYAYKSIDNLFAHAYGICHVKEWEIDETNRPVHVDMVKTFGILKHRRYKGYCSIEWDSPGDPYAGTAALIENTTRYLSETS